MGSPLARARAYYGATHKLVNLFDHRFSTAGWWLGKHSSWATTRIRRKDGKIFVKVVGGRVFGIVLSDTYIV